MKELRKCPFCGGEAKAKTVLNKSNHCNVGFIFEIVCTECGTTYPKQYGIDLELQEDLSITIVGEDKREEAINDWNNRVSSY